MIESEEPPVSCIADHSDCNDEDPAIHPGSDEICDELDNDCDGLVDEDGVCSVGRISAPWATDLDQDLASDVADRTHITVAWKPVANATYYKVYRSPYDADGEYELVADNITGTSFDYIQTWEGDVRAVIGDMPALSPTADFGLTTGPYPEREAFIAALNDYRDAALPVLFNFKAPAFFKVQACNYQECTELSEADLGQAEFLHTEAFSEVAQVAIPIWIYPTLVSLADAPPETRSILWCGIDLCGPGGGIVRGRMSATGYVSVDVQYDNYTETDHQHTGAYLVANGQFGGSMEPVEAASGEYLLAGDFTLGMTGRTEFDLSMFAHIGNYNSDGTSRFNEGVATITYNGQAYQFTLPLQPIDGISGHAAAVPEPVVPMQNTKPDTWYPSEFVYPLPSVRTTRCMRVMSDYVVPDCSTGARTYYQDADGDGYGTSEVFVLSVEPPDGYVAEGKDCNDTDPSIHPDAEEICNGVDDNCDNQTDECCTAFYGDADGDGYGNAAMTIQACTAPDGYVPDGRDCDDANAAVHPDAKEFCNDLDDDCDGLMDLEDPDCSILTYYQDADNDGFGNAAVSVETCAAPPVGYVTVAGDCDDVLATISPDAMEICDGLDNNCDGGIDEGTQSTFYQDADGDGFGNPAETILACVLPAGYVTDSSDCDDTMAGVHPGAEEICDNTIDENCDGIVYCGPQEIEIMATDLGEDLAPNASDRAHVTILWNPIDGASYYRVYRSPYIENGEYELVGDNIAGTSFVYVQTWEDDVQAVIGDPPALSPTADFGVTTFPFPEREAFIAALNDYRDAVLPVLFNFKAPAFFKVQACDDQGCTELSAADLGQAEFLHTESFSEVAQVAIPIWIYPVMISLADMPPGANALTWCGVDLCGSGGGIARGRVSSTGFVSVDVQYENYTETHVTCPGAYLVANGTFGGSMEPAEAASGELIFSGDFTLRMKGRAEIDLSVFAHIGNYQPDGASRINEGIATITYNGLAYQFTLPVQPVDGMSAAAAMPMEAVIPIQDTQPDNWYPSETVYPLPEVGIGRCMRTMRDYTIPECSESMAP